MEAPEDLHVPERLPRPQRSWVDVAFSVSAMLVSVISLIAAFQHGQAMEKLVETNARQASAAVWPYLELAGTVNRGPSANYAVSIQNNGVGPARLYSYEVLVDGQPTRNLDDLMTRCCGENAAAGYILQTNSSVSDRVLPAGAVIVPYRIAAPPQRNDAFDAVLNGLLSERVEARACYCSVFDECWTVSSRAGSAEPVEACPAATTFE